jgi:phage-related protein
LQHGLEPEDFKYIKDVGPGAYEIRIKEPSGAFRVIYVAKFADAVHILHAVQKKTQQTSQQDIALAKTRYKDLKHYQKEQDRL